MTTLAEDTESPPFHQSSLTRLLNRRTRFRAHTETGVRTKTRMPRPDDNRKCFYFLLSTQFDRLIDTLNLSWNPTRIVIVLYVHVWHLSDEWAGSLESPTRSCCYTQTNETGRIVPKPLLLETKRKHFVLLAYDPRYRTIHLLVLAIPPIVVYPCPPEKPGAYPPYYGAPLVSPFVPTSCKHTQYYGA
jgi:hypothetical protein